MGKFEIDREKWEISELTGKNGKISFFPVNNELFFPVNQKLI